MDQDGNRRARPAGARRTSVDAVIHDSRHAAPAHRSHAFDFQATEVSELGSHATALPYLGYLLQDPWDAVVIGRDGIVPIKVPQPARYCLHKLGIAALRPSVDATKITKDIMQAAVLAVILTLESSDQELLDASAAMPPGLRKKAVQTLPALAEMLSTDYPHVMQSLEDVVKLATSHQRRKKGGPLETVDCLTRLVRCTNHRHAANQARARALTRV